MKQRLAILSVGLVLASATPALCDTLATHCVKQSCVRERCDEWGENCSPIGPLERTKSGFVAPQSHQVCNEFGDCHFAPPTFPPVAQPAKAVKSTTPPAPATPPTITAPPVVGAPPAIATPPAPATPPAIGAT
jgi:hypothetical protein